MNVSAPGCLSAQRPLAARGDAVPATRRREVAQPERLERREPQRRHALIDVQQRVGALILGRGVGHGAEAEAVEDQHDDAPVREPRAH
jgi:hypothetical protein